VYRHPRIGLWHRYCARRKRGPRVQQSVKMLNHPILHMQQWMLTAMRNSICRLHVDTVATHCAFCGFTWFIYIPGLTHTHHICVCENGRSTGAISGTGSSGTSSVLASKNSRVFQPTDAKISDSQVLFRAFRIPQVLFRAFRARAFHRCYVGHWRATGAMSGTGGHEQISLGIIQKNCENCENCEFIGVAREEIASFYYNKLCYTMGAGSPAPPPWDRPAAGRSPHI